MASKLVEKAPGWFTRILMPELVEIKGELKNINTRIESTNGRIDSLDSKIDSLRNELKLRSQRWIRGLEKWTNAFLERLKTWIRDWTSFNA